MNNKLTVLLGAGFSANADMPMARKIAEYFNRDLKEKLLNFSSSEWAWIDNKDDVTINNGWFSLDRLAYSYVFNELVNRYKEDRGNFINYEDFYQYIIDKAVDSIWVEDLFEESKKELLKDKEYLIEDEYYKSYLFPFEAKQYFKVLPILDYLISDLLFSIPKNDEELKEIYLPFINYIKGFDEVNIFTLNHDLLLEKLFSLFDIDYNRGFGIENSPLIYKEKAIPVFNNDFTKKVKIYKLHGSIDIYRFDHCEKAGAIYIPNGDYDYYLTTNYYEKHDTQRIDPQSKEIIQDYNFDIVPKFITGTNKTELIRNDKMYRELFEQYQKIISETENLLISGYSFCDEHINVELEKNSNINYINHNRSKNYPFKGHGDNIKRLDELNI